MKKQMEPLTEQESAFAAEHHQMVSRYLNRKELPEDEYYDVVVFGYLHGVQKYFRREDLRRQYAFSTIAWSAMNTCLINYERDKARPKNQAILLSIHEPFCGPYLLEEMISDARDYAEETLEAICVRETLESFSQTEREIVDGGMFQIQNLQDARLQGRTDGRYDVTNSNKNLEQPADAGCLKFTKKRKDCLYEPYVLPPNKNPPADHEYSAANSKKACAFIREKQSKDNRQNGLRIQPFSVTCGKAGRTVSAAYLCNERSNNSPDA